MKTRALVPAVLFLFFVPSVAQSPAEAEPTDPFEALVGGEHWLRFHYRYEDVDQRGVAKNAHASTLRTVLGYETLSYHGFRGLLEFEDVHAIGDDAYNSTVNGTTNRPVVADPEGSEVNQAYLAYGAESGLEARAGRQRIKLDNDRFVGNVVWRQNEQTFDAVSVTHPLGEGAEVFAAFVDNVNTIFGESSAGGDAPMASLLVHASVEAGVLGTLVGYWYDLDYDRSASAGLSTSTLGARLHGKRDLTEEAAATYTLEYARQSDAGDNPNNVDEGYYHLQLGAEMSGVALQLGFEVLEGSGTPGEVFTTPLATLHAFNGWADKFLIPAMPNTGLEDAYLSVGCKVKAAQLKAIYHDFSSEDTSADYGRELDLMVSAPIGEHLAWGLKYANYMERGFATDTEKVWTWLGLSF